MKVEFVLKRFASLAETENHLAYNSDNKLKTCTCPGNFTFNHPFDDAQERSTCVKDVKQDRNDRFHIIAWAYFTNNDGEY